MRILVIGASGRVGRRIVASALQTSHAVTALVRNPDSLSELQHINLTIIKGSPTSADDLQKCFDPAIGKPDAVLTALGFSLKPLAPENFMRDTLATVIEVMTQHGVTRLVTLSSFGVGASWMNMAWPLKLAFRHLSLAYGHRDHTAVEAMLKEEKVVKWTLVKPVMLKDDGEVKETRVMGAEGDGVGMLDSCTTGSVGEFMIRVLDREQWLGESVVIAN